jgi:hypothetical protein
MNVNLLIPINKNDEIVVASLDGTVGTAFYNTFTYVPPPTLPPTYNSNLNFQLVTAFT